MKKLIVLFLCGIYLVLTSGMVMYTHLCKGVIQETSFATKGQENKKTCSFCSTKKQIQQNGQGDCCQEEARVVQLKEDIVLSDTFFFFAKLFGDGVPARYFGAVFETDFPHPKPAINLDIALNRPTKHPLYILHNVYRL